MRVAWCPDLGGLPLDPRVRDVLAAQRATFESLGCVVDDVAPDLKDAEYAFITIRSFRSAATYGPLLDEHRDLLKRDAIEEIEAGRALTTAEVARAMLMYAQLMERMRKFEETYAFTLCAVNQLPPFDAKIEWPHDLAGVRMEHYIAWQKTCYWISATHATRDLGARRLHAGGSAGRDPDRRPAPRGPLGARARARVRAGDEVRRQAPADLVR